MWVTDSGYIVDKKELPITELIFLQDLGGKANITLGPLECVGKGNYMRCKCVENYMYDLCISNCIISDVIYIHSVTFVCLFICVLQIHSQKMKQLCSQRPIHILT